MDVDLGDKEIAVIEGTQERILHRLREANEQLDNFEELPSQTLQRLVIYSKKVLKLRENIQDTFLRLGDIQSRLRAIAAEDECIDVE